MISQNNTWQGLVITDGIESYALYIYRCGDMTWAYSPTIGFNAAGNSFANHPDTGSTNAEEIACLNTPLSQWYNLVYQISLPNATNQTSLPTIEPRKIMIIFFTSVYPFGEYYYSCAYIKTIKLPHTIVQ